MLVTKLLYTPPPSLFVLYTTDLYHLWVSIFPQKFPTILLYRNSEGVCKSKDAEQNRSKTNINKYKCRFIVDSSHTLLPRSHLNDYHYQWFLHAKLINNSRISFVWDDWFFFVLQEESGETASSESNGVSEWLCPLCQKRQTCRSSLSLHLTEQHSVLPSCVDKLLDIVSVTFQYA